MLAGETPIPPSSGVRVRTLHLARQLAQAFDVHVLALGAVPTAAAEPFELTAIPHRWGRSGPLLRSLRTPYMAAKLSSQAAARLATAAAPRTVQAELPFLAPPALETRAPVVLDAHNVETELLRSLAESEPRRAWRLRWRWEARKTERFERGTALAVEAVCATSEHDAATFERWGATEIVVVPNGVDIDGIAYEEPASAPMLVYVGSYGYRPNALAARELVKEVFPVVRRAVPHAGNRLVGREPEAVLQELPPGVEATGEVDDTVEHLRQAAALVVPRRAGSGTRLKILEAMAAGVPVVATPLAVAGLDVRDGEHVLLGQTSHELAGQAIRLLEDRALARQLSTAARADVEQRFAWSVVARPLVELHARLGAAP